VSPFIFIVVPIGLACIATMIAALIAPVYIRKAYGEWGTLCLLLYSTNNALLALLLVPNYRQYTLRVVFRHKAHKVAPGLQPPSVHQLRPPSANGVVRPTGHLPVAEYASGTQHSAVIERRGKRGT